MVIMKRSSSTIPFGYKLNEEDNTKLDKIPEELEVLQSIVPMIKDKTLSLRDGSAYLSHMTGRSISHVGLKKIIEKRNFE
jgi:hypothetical protein